MEEEIDLRTTLIPWVGKAGKMIGIFLGHRLQEADFDLTSKQWLLLRILSLEDGRPQQDLAVITERNKTSLVRLIDTRKIILILLGLIILAGALYVARDLISSRTVPRPRERKVITSVFTQTVENGEVPITITTNGVLTAKKRLELFSEVQGLFEASDGEFKPGEHYREGSLLLRINSDFRAIV